MERQETQLVGVGSCRWVGVEQQRDLRLGGIGAICLLGLFMFFVLKIFSVAKTSLESGKIFAGYACYFVGLTFALQFLVNVGVNTGMLPTKGLTLPFISYGGNSLLISCAMVGLVLRAALVDEADHG